MLVFWNWMKGLQSALEVWKRNLRPKAPAVAPPATSQIKHQHFSYTLLRLKTQKKGIKTDCDCESSFASTPIVSWIFLLFCKTIEVPCLPKQPICLFSAPFLSAVTVAQRLRCRRQTPRSWLICRWWQTAHSDLVLLNEKFLFFLFWGLSILRLLVWVFFLGDCFILF